MKSRNQKAKLFLFSVALVPFMVMSARADVVKRDHRQKKSTSRTVPRQLVRNDIEVVLNMCSSLSTYSESHKCFNKATASLINGDDARILVLKGCSVLDISMSSAQCFEKGVQKKVANLGDANPKLSRSLKRIVQACGELSNYSDSNKCFQIALESSRNLHKRPRAYVRGLDTALKGCEGIGNMSSVACYEKALTTAVEYPNLYVMIHNMCKDLGLFSDVNSCYMQAISTANAYKRRFSNDMDEIKSMCSSVSGSMNSAKCFESAFSDLIKGAHKYVELQYFQEQNNQPKQLQEIAI